MTSGFFPGGYGSPFDEFFSRYMGGPRQRIDITQFLSERAREVVNAAARHAAGTGSTDVDTSHLLLALLGEDPVRQLLARVGSDPERLRNQLGAALGRSGARPAVPASPPG